MNDLATAAAAECVELTDAAAAAAAAAERENVYFATKHCTVLGSRNSISISI